ncbi:CAAX amino terminal protease family protein [Streptococcus sp. DD11]|uniref:CPBP family intramembrane glutamic endopeptidase n=1 Tax=Streptococcus sp. DD11 TaxID=1777879 RepID=UPI0007943D1C|nr:CPBP family intramembrane glutamic endopeptidase [Streptococcus sp. DD11]KXT84796.1 CAAX amino terminal protease family protein [Streptococcus sp. DD11]
MQELRKHNLTGILLIYMACFSFRIAEYLFLRTDQTILGEAFVHKLLGLGFMLAALHFYRLKLEQIGFQKEGFVRNTLIGFIWGLIAFALAYLLEMAVLISQGGFRGLDFYVSAYSVSGNIGQHREMIFVLLCLAGNLINVLMEEGIFRGLFQKLFERKHSFMTAAVCSNILFGLWHIMAPLRSLLDGEMSLTGFWLNSLILVVTSFLIGFQFSLMTKLTGSLYMGMAAHFVNNTVVNLFHVLSKNGADQLLTVRISIAQTLSLLALLIYYRRLVYLLLRR